MNNLKDKSCKPCEGGVCPLDEDLSKQQLDLVPGWELTEDKTGIVRTLRFKDFLTTMSFINAMAWVVNEENHHPDFSAGYNYCNVGFSTHAIDGLSDNDFICAARIEALFSS